MRVLIADDNDLFRSALDAQARLVAGPAAFPPSYQWLLSSRVWSPLDQLLRLVCRLTLRALPPQHVNG